VVRSSARATRRSLGAQEATPESLARQRLPEWAQAAVAEPAFEQPDTFDLRMNPFVLEGDFDRGGQRDAAIWVRNRGLMKPVSRSFVARAHTSM
jgi:hypothetical protein